MPGHLQQQQQHPNYHNNNNNNNNMEHRKDDLVDMLKGDSELSSEDSPLASDELDASDAEAPAIPVVAKRLTVAGTTGNGSDAVGTFKCAQCDKAFNRVCYLTQHNNTFHKGDKPFKCHMCGKRFQNAELFSQHQQKHAGDKPYKCPLCPKQFNHKTDLRRHMCLHTGQKPFMCQVCNKGFIRKDHMVKHVQTHTRRNALHANAPSNAASIWIDLFTFPFGCAILCLFHLPIGFLLLCFMEFFFFFLFLYSSIPLTIHHPLLSIDGRMDRWIHNRETTQIHLISTFFTTTILLDFFLNYFLVSN